MIRTLCLAALLLAGTPALVAAQSDGDPCPEARTQSEMNECPARQFARADTVLNERYRELLRVLAPEPNRVAALRAAQRAWIRFRDADCDFEASAFEGGSMRPMIDLACMAHRTEQRTAELAMMIREASR